MNVYRTLKDLGNALKDFPKLKGRISDTNSKVRSIKQASGRFFKDCLERLNLLNQGINSLNERTNYGLNSLNERTKWLIGSIDSCKTQIAESIKAEEWALSLPPPPVTTATRSSLCKQVDFLKPHHAKWCELMKIPLAFHRKHWEFTFILESLSQRGMLTPGKRGLGFAVGTEPLPACYASFGCEVVATDIDPAAGTEKGWTHGNQLCFELADLNKLGICENDAFRKLCSYRPVDMNAIPEDLHDFDFTWSSCSFEHLGSIERGLSFLKNQMRTLKPGGWAVHTTEFNISSNTDTLEEPNCVIFRQQDIDRVVADLRGEGHFVADLDYSLGWMPLDYKVDLPPYSSSPHLRMLLQRYVCTSIGIIIQKKAN